MSSLFMSTNALCRKMAGLTLKTDAAAFSGRLSTRSTLSSSTSCLPFASNCHRFTSSARNRCLVSSASLDAKFWTIGTRSKSTTATSEVTKAPTLTTPQIIHSEDGRRFAAFDMQKHPKLKPYIVRRRLDRMKTYVGLPLPEALTQLEFCQKSRAPLVQKVLRRTANLADIRDGLQPSQLEVAECFATKGTPLKRIKTMGRGRFGRMERKHSHMRVVLREVDFKLRIYQAESLNQKKKWFMLQQQAERDGARASAEREEVKRLEREAFASTNTK